MTPTSAETGIIPFSLLDLVDQLNFTQLTNAAQSYGGGPLANFLHVHRLYLPRPRSNARFELFYQSNHTENICQGRTAINATLQGMISATPNILPKASSML
jgi:hypothetical protein